MKGSYRTQDGRAQIDWTLEERENGPVFSASGEYAGGCGQCLDSIATAYPDDEIVQRIHRVWKQYHLNDLEVPIPSNARATGGFPEGATTYRYDTRWVYVPIPAEVLEEIRSWRELKQHRNPLHEDAATAFLRKHDMKLRATHHGDKCPIFCDGTHQHGDRYRITISRKGGGRLSFDFWNSVNDVLEGKAPTAYIVLATISSDAYCPDSLDEFCSEYGYDEDGKKTRQVWKRCLTFSSRIQAFFESDELRELGEIR